MDPWTYEQREHEAQERFERREREIEDESLAASIMWHPDVSCGAFECVNGCDGAPDYCATALAFLGNSDVVTRRATAPEGPPDVSECSGMNP